MPRIPRLCLLGLCAAAVGQVAAEDAPDAPGLITGKDALTLSLALGGRYDSNPDAVASSSQAEYDGLATAGGNLTTTLDALDRLSFQGTLQALASNRDEDRRELLGAGTLRFNRIEEIHNLVADAQFSRTDDPNQLTGSQVVADTYRGDARFEWNDERDRYAIMAIAASTQYQGGIAGVPAADLDSTTTQLGLDYGRKVSELSLLTLRLLGTWIDYRRTDVSQDSEGLSLLGGWESQISRQDSWSVAAGVEVNHYQSNAVDPVYNGVSPTVRVALHRPWGDRGLVTLAVAEDLRSSVLGNPAIVTTANLDASYPLAHDWIGRIGCGGNQIRDTHSNAGVPKDLRTTGQARCGIAWIIAGGLTLDASALCEDSAAHIAPAYHRVGGQVTLTQVF